MTNRLVLMAAVLVTTVAAQCGPARPIRINSDPNQETLDRTHDKIEADDVEIYIRNHPELDEETRRGLRDGTISRSEATRRAREKAK